MNRRFPALVASMGLLLPLLAACGNSNSSSSSSNSGSSGSSSGSKGGTVSASTKCAKDITQPAPAVPNAAAAKKYKGQTIIYYGDGVGIGHDMDTCAAARFTKDTGINIKVVIKPQDSNEAYSTYTRLFNAHSTNIDAMMIDVIWPSAFGQNLLDLKPYISNSGQYYSSIIQNDTIGGRLVAIPWFGDFGMLYYRTDLLKKYGIASPPTTWDELAADAAKIQAGEQKKNKAFYGFVWQGKAYEGLTCDALEWLASSGGGQIIQNGKVTINNPKAVAMLNKVKSWVGTISPKDVTTYTEVESDNAFNNGDAAFLRNWPYAYAVAQQTPKIKGKVGVVQLPDEPGYPHVGTVGGWQLAVNKYSKSPAAAAQWVKYLTSPQVEKWRAIVGSFVPTIPAVTSDPAVQKAEPFLATAGKATRVTRPSRFLGTKYNQASNQFWTAVNQVETGSDASSILPTTAQQLQQLVKM